MKCFSFLMSLFFIQLSSAQLVSSIKNGNWSDTTVWSTGSIPNALDSVVIDDYILLDTNLVIENTGLLFIDGCGVVCGDFDITGGFTNYGEIRIRNSNIYTTSFNYGVLTCSGTNVIYSAQGGALYNCCGGTVSINTPVNCNGFPRGCNTVLSTESLLSSSTSFLRVELLPTDWKIHISSDAIGNTMQIINLNGQTVLEQLITTSDFLCTHTALTSGIYILKAGNLIQKAAK